MRCLSRPLTQLLSHDFRCLTSIHAPLSDRVHIRPPSISSRVGQKRLFVSHVPSVLIPPAVFLALGIGLWTWKCMMMVVFQNKIIYMPGLPPNSRKEKISDYSTRCQGIKWEEKHIKSSDGTEIALCVSATRLQTDEAVNHVYILYFQGNASSTPPRLPFLSPVVKTLESNSGSPRNSYVFVAVSYRGYWTSRGRPSEAGITLDALSALAWISSQHQDSQAQVSVVVWGQSIGSGIASALVANYATELSATEVSSLNIKGLILETPFTNVRDMLVALYPQKWLPYRYLWPFLRNHLDTLKALEVIGKRSNDLEVVIVEAGRDELVPPEHGLIIEKKCSDLGIMVRKETVKQALHTEVLGYYEGQKIITAAIMRA